jgi:hypothetical protein
MNILHQNSKSVMIWSNEDVGLGEEPAANAFETILDDIDVGGQDEELPQPVPKSENHRTTSRY